MSEFFDSSRGPMELGPVEELRAAIDAITDGNPHEPLSLELQDRFIEAVSRVAEKYDKSPSEMTQLVDTIMLEDR